MGYQFNPFTGNLDIVGDGGGGGGGGGDITAVTAGTGLSGGGTSGSVTLSLANTAVAAGSYTYGSFTVDAQGRITSASNGTAPVTGVTAGTGLSGGGAGGGVTLTLANTAVAAGSYTYGSFTVDAQGRITSASSGTAVTTSAAGLAPATGFSALTYGATTDLDLSALDGQYRTITLTGDLTFTTSNRANGRKAVLRLVPGASQRTLTFPAGWVFVGTKPATLAASKTAVLSLTFFGTADTDCVAAYAVQS